MCGGLFARKTIRRNLRGGAGRTAQVGLRRFRFLTRRRFAIKATPVYAREGEAVSISVEAATRSQRSWRAFMWSAFGSVLLGAAVAGRLTNEMNWSAGDFLAAAALLGAVGIAIEFASRLVGNRSVRTALIMSFMTVGCLVWAQAAVGIF